MAWLSGWSLRKKLYINGTGQTIYPMMITVNQGIGNDTTGNIYCNGNVNSDFSDIRFTSSDGSTFISYWLDAESISGISPNRVIKVWVKIPNTGTGSNSTFIYFYYNNSSAPTTGPGTSDGAATFIFFDDFPGTTIDATKWTVGTGVNPGPSGQFPSGSYGVSSGYWWTCYATSSDLSVAITSVNNIVDVNKSIDFDMQVTSYTNGSAWNAAQRYAYFSYYSATLNEVDLAYPYPGNPNYVSYPINTATIYTVQIAYVSSIQAKVYVNGTFWGNLTLSGVPAKAVFQARDLHLTSACMNVRLYNVRVRPYTTSEPSWSTISPEIPITITSNPTGAEIFIAPHNGTYVDQGITTDNTIGLVPGNYDIKLTKGGYQDWYLTNQTFSAGQSYLIQATLSLLPGSIALYSTPSGASIYLDGSGTSSGTTVPGGITLTNISVGSHSIRLSLTGYTDWTGSATVNTQTTTTVRAVFAGNANITSTPSNAAAIYLDGSPTPIGNTPLIITNLTTTTSDGTQPTQYHTYILILTGYVDTSGSFTATAGTTVNVPVTFPGSLYITSIPTGASIYIDGILQ